MVSAVDPNKKPSHGLFAFLCLILQLMYRIIWGFPTLFFPLPLNWPLLRKDLLEAALLNYLAQSCVPLSLPVNCLTGSWISILTWALRFVKMLPSINIYLGGNDICSPWTWISFGHSAAHRWCCRRCANGKEGRYNGMWVFFLFYVLAVFSSH